MSTNIEPCPYCKCDGFNSECQIETFRTGKMRVECSECTYGGRAYSTAAEAIAVHNALCSAEQRGYERGVRAERQKMLSKLQQLSDELDDAVNDSEGSLNVETEANYLDIIRRSLLPDNPTTKI